MHQKSRVSTRILSSTFVSHNEKMELQTRRLSHISMFHVTNFKKSF